MNQGIRTFIYPVKDINCTSDESMFRPPAPCGREGNLPELLVRLTSRQIVEKLSAAGAD